MYRKALDLRVRATESYPLQLSKLEATISSLEEKNVILTAQIASLTQEGIEELKQRMQDLEDYASFLEKENGEVRKQLSDHNEDVGSSS